MPADLPAILAVADARGIPVVEDAACAIGSKVEVDGRWESIGKPHGRIACFSFHPRKVITTGDGGMLTTNDSDLDARFRLLRQHAMSVPDTVRHASSEVIFEGYPELGYNYRMTDIQAAIGIRQLQRLPALVRERRTLASAYTEQLEELPVSAPREPRWARSNWQSYCVLCPDVSQKALMQAMQDRGVATRRAVMCSHREVAYATPSVCRLPVEGLPVSEYVQDHGLLLPLYPGMGHGIVGTVVRTLAEAVKICTGP
jgi:dTDP-4-amino-4,6-dideoxygalactose transaminase